MGGVPLDHPVPGSAVDNHPAVLGGFHHCPGAEPGIRVMTGGRCVAVEPDNIASIRDFHST